MLAVASVAQREPETLRHVAGDTEYPPTYRVSSGQRCIVKLHGELDTATADGVADAGVEIAGSTVVVDMSELTFMDSTGITALAIARNRILAANEDQLVVTRPTGIVRRALEVVGLSAWIVDW